MGLACLNQVLLTYSLTYIFTYLLDVREVHLHARRQGGQIVELFLISHFYVYGYMSVGSSSLNYVACELGDRYQSCWVAVGRSSNSNWRRRNWTTGFRK